MKLRNWANAENAETIEHRSIACLRRDLFAFMEYARERPIKRSHRENLIPKDHAKRLVKRYAFPGAAQELEDLDYSAWSEHLSRLARQMKLVDFDVKGVYAGYSSQEPSYPENWIEVQTKNYDAYLALSSLSKERALLDALVRVSESEFYCPSDWFESSRFSESGRAVGMGAEMDLPKVRLDLLELLVGLPTGEWLDFAALVSHLKNQHRFLILPEAPKRKHSHALKNRYEYFYEEIDENRWGHQVSINATDRDAFERVEGRFLAYFLESIPFEMGFVDLMLGESQLPSSKKPIPSYGHVKALRVSPRLRAVLQPDLHAREVWEGLSATLLPTFELVLESPLYCEAELKRLEPYTILLAQETAIRLQLDKKKVKTAFAQGVTFDALKEDLHAVGVRELPQNVSFELRQWAGQADDVVLYRNVAMVETLQPALSARIEALLPLQGLHVANLAPGIGLYRSPERVKTLLDEAAMLSEHRHFPEELFVVESNDVTPPLKPSRSRWQAHDRATSTRIRITCEPHVVIVCEPKDFISVMRTCLDRAARPYLALDSMSGLLVTSETKTFLLAELEHHPEASRFEIVS